MRCLVAHLLFALHMADTPEPCGLARITNAGSDTLGTAGWMTSRACRSESLPDTATATNSDAAMSSNAASVEAHANSAQRLPCGNRRRELSITIKMSQISNNVDGAGDGGLPPRTGSVSSETPEADAMMIPHCARHLREKFRQMERERNEWKSAAEAEARAHDEARTELRHLREDSYRVRGPDGIRYLSEEKKNELLDAVFSPQNSEL